MILKACTDVPDLKKYIQELGGIALVQEAPSPTGSGKALLPDEN